MHLSFVSRYLAEVLGSGVVGTPPKNRDASLFEPRVFVLAPQGLDQGPVIPLEPLEVSYTFLVPFPSS